MTSHRDVDVSKQHGILDLEHIGNTLFIRRWVHRRKHKKLTKHAFYEQQERFWIFQDHFCDVCHRDFVLRIRKWWWCCCELLVVHLIQFPFPFHSISPHRCITSIRLRNNEDRSRFCIFDGYAACRCFHGTCGPNHLPNCPLCRSPTQEHRQQSSWKYFLPKPSMEVQEACRGPRIFR